MPGLQLFFLLAPFPELYWIWSRNAASSRTFPFFFLLALFLLVQFPNLLDTAATPILHQHTAGFAASTKRQGQQTLKLNCCQKHCFKTYPQLCGLFLMKRNRLHTSVVSRYWMSDGCFTLGKISKLFVNNAVVSDFIAVWQKQAKTQHLTPFFEIKHNTGHYFATVDTRIWRLIMYSTSLLWTRWDRDTLPPFCCFR